MDYVSNSSDDLCYDGMLDTSVRHTMFQKLKQKLKLSSPIRTADFKCIVEFYTNQFERFILAWFTVYIKYVKAYKRFPIVSECLQSWATI